MGLLVLVASTMLLWPFLTAGPLVTSVEVRQLVTHPPSVNVRGALRVITLNLAHGRGDGLHQMLLSKAAIQRNLDGVAAVLRRDPAVIVGVQEADTDSFWSGRFNHVEYLARTAGFSQFAVGLQVQGMGLNYGVGVLSRIPLMDGTTYRFKARGLTANKGFVVCTFQWPGPEFSEVDFVVLHLDYLRDSTRKRQLAEVSVALKKRKHPLILVGDFNATWQDSEGLLPTFVRTMNLRVFEPDRTDLATFPGNGQRLDWILVSEELELLRYENLRDKISDHSVVVAEIGARQGH